MIKKLKSNLINQIAAGEVVDDPCAIVKELIENSIDANAKNIEIILYNGGVSKIIIIDDGDGISKDELPKAFERFATSKIKSLDDLNNISTLGYRGEALPSIASVSEIIIKTKNITSKVGNKIKLSFGKEVYFKPSSIESGTYIEVKNIFHNVPARKKFLKSESYEYRKILALFKTFAICNYSISFKLINNDKVIYNLKNSTLLDRIQAMYGKDVSQSTIPISYKKDKYEINGFIGNLSLVKSTRNYQYLFINDRPIKNQLINTSINNAYKSLIDRSEYPFFILFLTLPPLFIDVNVHPKKQEVKFQNEMQIQHIFRKAVSDGLKDIFKTIPSYSSININDNVENTILPFNMMDNKQESLISMSNNSSHKYDENIKAAEFRLKNLGDDKITIESNNIWQIHNKYIITEITSGIIIIDQHVAHERILYESSKKSLEGDGLSSQKILFPKVIKFDPEEYIFLLEIISYLEKIGFEFREFGENTIILEGVPSNLPLEHEENIIREILNQYIKTKNTNSAFIEYMASTYACKAAIKAGDKLSPDECRELVDELFSTEHPYYCPHGRPIIINLTLSDLDTRFERH
tara:strand:+ start:20763 stop:22502 length:1740 start_codon:yes stop_codon:yes gene_type:complete